MSDISRIAEEKMRLRREMKALRRTLQSEEADGRIAKNALAAFGKYDRFFVYLSFGTEVSTKELIRLLLQEGKQVLVPRLAGGTMLAVPYSDKLIRSPLGYLEPQAGEDALCEVCFAPLLAADGEGNRLGYGGGYYDGYFARRPSVLRVGLCYEGQLLERVPAGRSDLPLQAIVTERRTELLDSFLPL